MLWELDRLGDSVDDPTEEDFACRPLGISFSEFAQGDGFGAMLVIRWVVWSEDVVYRVEDSRTDSFSEARVALR